MVYWLASTQCKWSGKLCNFIQCQYLDGWLPEKSSVVSVWLQLTCASWIEIYLEFKKSEQIQASRCRATVATQWVAKNWQNLTRIHNLKAGKSKWPLERLCDIYFDLLLLQISVIKMYCFSDMWFWRVFLWQLMYLNLIHMWWYFWIFFLLNPSLTNTQILDPFFNPRNGAKIFTHLYWTGGVASSAPRA